MTEPLVREIALRCSPEHAFAAFTTHVDLWWPRGHRKHPEGRLAFEPRTGGRLMDLAPDGTPFVMAVVTAFEPPHRLVLDWYPGSPAAPTRADVSFEPEPSGTRVRIVHTAPTAAAAEVWPLRVGLFERGWDAVLSALRTKAEMGDEG